LTVLIDRGADCSPELDETKAQPSSDSVLFLSAGRSRPARAVHMPVYDLAAVRSELLYSRVHPVAFLPLTPQIRKPGEDPGFNVVF
jgi:hypothetical protein